MANWSQVKVENVKVISHERVEDTDPNTYIARGKWFKERGQWKEAEQEYSKAVRFSNFDWTYVYQLIYFYYETNDKAYEKKGNVLYKKWHEVRSKSGRYFSLCYTSLIIAAICIISSLIYVILGLIGTCGMIYYSNRRINMMYAARGKNSQYIGRCVLSAIWMLIFAVATSLFMFEGEGVLTQVVAFESGDIIFYSSKIVGFVALLVGIVSFWKWITNMQKEAKRKDGLWVKILAVAKVMGALLILVVGAGFSYQAIEERRQVYYKEAHDGWLNEEELEKVQQMESDIFAKTGVHVRYFQIMQNDTNVQVETEGQYLYLVYSSMGLSFEFGERKYYTNVLTQEELDSFATCLAVAYNQEMTDIEKCEYYFEYAKEQIRLSGPVIEESQLKDDDEDSNDAEDGWELSLNKIYYELTNDKSLEELKKDLNVVYVNTFEMDSCQTGSFYAQLYGYTGIMSYNMNYNAENTFVWYVEEVLTEEALIWLFDVSESERVNARTISYNWRNKLILRVVTESTSTEIEFSLQKVDESSEEEQEIEVDKNIDYLALSELEQRKYIASSLGKHVDNYIYYDKQTIDGSKASMFEYVDDDGGAADFLILLFSDGTIKKYYVDGTILEI